jgi:endonuclease/exonuclease/phosphatase family metal-dependent hydrolase
LGFRLFSPVSSRTPVAALVAGVFLVLAFRSEAQTTNTFTVAAYNVENWLLMERGKTPDQPKPLEERQAVWQVLSALRPDVLSLCEVGTTNDFAEIAQGLQERGLDYPHREWIEGGNLDRHVALLSRFPIAERHSRTNESYTLDGQRRVIERGILDVAIRVNDRYSFRAVMVHLKSKRQSELGDEAEMRLNEARLLRRHVETALAANPRLNMLVMGDMNDTADSETIRTIIGTAPPILFDLMPATRKGQHGTHFWRWRREWSRIDYLLASPGMSNEYVAASARIAAVEGSEKASDHRAIYAQFLDHDIGEAAPALPATELEPEPAPKPAPRWLLVCVIGIGVAGLAVLGYVGYLLLRPPPRE